MISENPCKICLIRACCREMCDEKIKCMETVFGKIPILIATAVFLIYIYITN